MPPLTTFPQLPLEAFMTFKVNPLIEHLSNIRCGAYVSEWTAKSLGIDGPKTNEIMKAPSWRDYLHPILPRMIVKLLKERHLESVSYKVDSFKSDDQKIEWIKREIVTKKKPLLFLVKAATLHWVAVAGYDETEKVFYVYDPSFSATSINSDLPIGNIKMDYIRLLHEWQGSWIFKYITVLILSDPLSVHHASM